MKGEIRMGRKEREEKRVGEKRYGKESKKTKRKGV